MGWFRNSVAAFLPAPQLSSEWNTVLERATRGQATPADTAWVDRHPYLPDGSGSRSGST